MNHFFKKKISSNIFVKVCHREKGSYYKVWCPKDKRQKKKKKPRKALEFGNGKTRPYHPSLPHFVTIKEFQVLLSSITCLPFYPMLLHCFSRVRLCATP